MICFASGRICYIYVSYANVATFVACISVMLILALLCV